jgi:glycosyltransferase involved in cell wall biosynthesis
VVRESIPKIKVRHLTSVHEVDDSRILHRECKSLAENGYDIALIAARPPHDDLEGVRIVAVGPARTRLDRACRAAWRIYRAALHERADIYQFHDPELLWVGILLAVGGKTVVYDVHEDVPKQILNKFWLPRLLRRPLAELVRIAEWCAGAVCDAVVVANPPTARRFPAAKTVVVQNFPERAIACGAGIDFRERPYSFAYTGGLSEVQGVRAVVSAGELLGPGLPGALAGWFDDSRLEEELRASPGWRSVHYLGALPKSGVIEAIRNARSGVVVNKAVSQYLDAYSTKMFEYMACGVPVVCSNFPHWVEIVEDADCGVAVDPADPIAIAEAIRAVVTDPEQAVRRGENGRRAVLARYNWEQEFVKLDHLYRRLRPGAS